MDPLEESLVEIRYAEYSETTKCWRSRETTGFPFISAFSTF